MTSRPLALITGASRRIGIGAAVARQLADDGWNLALTFWRAYDESMPWGSKPDEVAALERDLEARGAATVAVEADLSRVETPARVFDAAEEALGPVTALVMSHCHSVDSDILGTTVESFDQHFAVNARATWLLVREFGKRFESPAGRGRILALTSDHVAFNLPYGASKGALDRIVLAAAQEYRDLGITANVINPGPVDTGWMTDQLIADVTRQTPGGRPGLPEDSANLASFLCSEAGGWINGQLLYSNGGFR
ncbi:MAG: SDR family oxidoreductase [Acidobacteriota bacterium]